LKNFSIAKDQELINVLKDIQDINPKVKIFATPWSAPAWMKTNQKLIGGSLKKEYYEVYAQYFVKYIKAMQGNGINIFAITPQNEPEHPGNEPSLVMTALEQADFIKNNLGQRLRIIQSKQKLLFTITIAIIQNILLLF
jgi:glucosylceramidase